MPDVILSKTIPEAKAVKAMPWFLREHPIPLDNDDNPMYGIKEWVLHLAFDVYIMGEIKEGRRKTLADAQDDTELEGIFVDTID